MSELRAAPVAIAAAARWLTLTGLEKSMARKAPQEEEIEILEDELDEDDDLEVVARRRAPGIGLFAAGIVLGALLGAGIAVLAAPARGEVTRRRVRRRFHNLQDDARDRFDDLRDDARRGLSRQRNRIRRRARR